MKLAIAILQLILSITSLSFFSEDSVGQAILCAIWVLIAEVHLLAGQNDGR